MIKIIFSKLKNGNLEITEKMLNDTLSYMKRQENYIKQLRQENILIFSNYGISGSGKSYCEKLKEKDLEIERLNNIINKVLFILEHIEDDRVGYETCIDLLKGVDKDEN